MDSLYGILTIVGPILLLAAIGWVTFNNRTTAREHARSEAATREMYKQQDAEDKAAERAGEE